MVTEDMHFMGIEDMPVIKNLEAFAQKLPQQDRQELYRIAEVLYVVGVADGIIKGSLAQFGEKQEPEKKELGEYLSRKAEE